jgi:polyisoprenoid-binding protein YceI
MGGIDMTAATATRTLDGVTLPAPGDWNLDPGHTTAGFVARHLVVTKVRGQFTDVAGVIHVGEAPEDSSVEVTIQAASVHTGDARRDEHLRSPDFLDAERFPTLEFRSTSVQGGAERWKVSGDLTVHGVTRPVVLDVEYNGASASPWGSQVTSFSARTEIDREDFGLTWNQALETGGVVVGKKVVVEIETEAILAQ